MLVILQWLSPVTFQVPGHVSQGLRSWGGPPTAATCWVEVGGARPSTQRQTCPACWLLSWAPPKPLQVWEGQKESHPRPMLGCPCRTPHGSGVQTLWPGLFWGLQGQPLVPSCSGSSDEWCQVTSKESWPPGALFSEEG